MMGEIIVMHLYNGIVLSNKRNICICAITLIYLKSDKILKIKGDRHKISPCSVIPFVGEEFVLKGYQGTFQGNSDVLYHDLGGVDMGVCVRARQNAHARERGSVFIRDTDSRWFKNYPALPVLILGRCHCRHGPLSLHIRVGSRRCGWRTV